MAHLRAQIWALPAAGDPAPLPHLRKWSVSPQDDAAGLIEFDYPAGGRNYDVLAETVADDVDLEVEVTVHDEAGRTWIDRAIVDEADLDDVDETSVGTFRGRLLSCIFDEVVIPYGLGENGTTVVSGTAGKIMRELLEAAQARGCLAGVTWTFTDSHDSAGQPWAREGVLTFNPGQLYRAVLGTLRGYQLSEWRLTADRELQLYNVDGKGVDRSTGPGAIVLERGRDLGDAPRKWRIRSALTALVSSGKDGIYSAASNATALARRGRRIEGYRSFGNTADQGTLDALTAADLGTKTAGAVEVSHKLVLGPGHPTPLLDFDIADWVLSATRAGVAKRRIKQITIGGDDAEATSASVTLGTVIDDVAVRQQAQIDALASGEAVAGTSTPPPDVDDGSTPDAPDDVVATSLWYATGEGVGLASVSAGWTAVPDARVVGYVPEWRYTDSALGTAWTRQAQTDATTASWSGVVAGANVDVRVYAVNKWGRLSAPSTTYNFTSELDGTPPPVPSTPAPYASLGLIMVPWDGLGSAAEPMPGDFDRVEIHIETTSGFTPSAATLAGELRAPGECPIDVGEAGYGSTFFVRLVSYDRTGNASAPSAQGSVVAAAVADGEISGLSIGKLVTGILSATMTISGLIRTAVSGARVELDAAGLRCYSSTGALLFEFNIATSIASLVGKVTAGAGVGSGATVVVDPSSPPRIDLYPTASANRTRLLARNTTRPGGGSAAGFELQTLNSSGQTDGFAMDAWSTNAWIGNRDTSGDWVGPLLILERNGVGSFQHSSGVGIKLDQDAKIAIGGKWFTWAGQAESGLFCGEVFQASGAGGLGILYGATADSIRCPIVTLDGSSVCQWLVSSNRTDGFDVIWSGTDSHWVRFWCFRV